MFVGGLAEVDDIGLLAKRFRAACRVPAAALDSFFFKKFYILTPSTAVVEEGHVLAEQPIAQEALYRPGKISPPDRCFVPLNRRGSHPLTVVGSGRYNLL